MNYRIGGTSLTKMRTLSLAFALSTSGASCVGETGGDVDIASTRLAATSTSCELESRACYGEDAPCFETAVSLIDCAAEAGCDLSSDVDCLESSCGSALAAFEACYFEAEECLPVEACFTDAEEEDAEDDPDAHSPPVATETDPNRAGVAPEFEQMGWVESLPTDAKLDGALSDCSGVGRLDGFGNAQRVLTIGLLPEPGFSKTFYPTQVDLSEDGSSARFTGGAGFAAFRGELRSADGVVRGTIELYDFATDDFVPFTLAPVSLPESGFVMGRASSVGEVLPDGGLWQLGCIPGAFAD